MGLQSYPKQKMETVRERGTHNNHGLREVHKVCKVHKVHKVHKVCRLRVQVKFLIEK